MSKASSSSVSRNSSAGAGEELAVVVAVATGPKVTAPPPAEEKKHAWKVPDFPDAKDLMKFKLSDEALAKAKPAVREFYQKQNEIIDIYHETDQLVGRIAEDEPEGEHKPLKGQPEEEDEEENVLARRAIRLSMSVNILLFGLKIFAALWSLSLAVIASTIDSFLDLLAGSIIFLTDRAVDKYDPYKYPQGKSRLEPLGTIVFAAVMGVASLQLVSEAATVMADGFHGKRPEITMDAPPLVIIGFTILSKICLRVYCLWVAGQGIFPGVEALAQDHRNDVLTNTVGLTLAVSAYYKTEVWFLDPLGAILLGIYIITNWVRTGKEQVAFLIGKTAPPDFIAQLTYIAAHHDSRILRVDTVLGYHFGVKYLAEVHVALSESISLREAHDIGEGLEHKLEKLELVERAFVHLDYEWQHKPEYYRHHKKTKAIAASPAKETEDLQASDFEPQEAV